ncbi:MAG: FumA C-terminus/TtdB family hydratase beta subunit [Lachnospiraceae bacterium]|nr:FumA C-terminus/TtdB family hydratase beta subunit [Lachnospiraceae bacterium]
MEIMTPFLDETIKNLRAGDNILLSGFLYTGRDAAHKRLLELAENGKKPPFDYGGQAIYYTGPCPAPPGRVIGSAGPTTSGRMDSFSPRLIKEGLRVMVGKGARGEAVTNAIKEHQGLYLAALGGAGALLSLCITESEVIAFADLGTEAIYRLTVLKMPLIVAIDSEGRSIYK